uniref:SFRICE_002014 n=1 Tax=Spodoptera frugiperda TaxID=7108 RepID=A0A2H1VSR6_SPOFR
MLVFCEAVVSLRSSRPIRAEASLFHTKIIIIVCSLYLLMIHILFKFILSVIEVIVKSVVSVETIVGVSRRLSRRVGVVATSLEPVRQIKTAYFFLCSIDTALLVTIASAGTRPQLQFSESVTGRLDPSRQIISN